MDWIDAIVLGVVQGLTEFLPISSTGHLILAREVLGLSTSYGLAVDAMLHLATALAVGWYFRNDFFALAKSVFYGGEKRPLLYAVVLGTIPAVVAGLLLEERMETVFRSAELVAWTLIAGSVLFLAAEYVARRYEGQPPREITPRRGLTIGLFQALALIPGMSRAGATISGGLFLGLSREEAARFGFMLSFPIILGSGAKKALELGSAGVFNALGFELLLSAVCAFGVGLLAIHYLLKYLRTHTLLVFVVYRVALACVVLWLL